MSQQLELLEVAKYLAQLIQTDIRSSPAEPELILSALKMLIPEAEELFDKIQQMSDQEKQWGQIIGFIQNQIMEEGMEFGFDKLDTEELVEVYKVVIQLVEEAMGDSQNGQSQQGEGQQQQEEQNKQNQSQMHQSNNIQQNQAQPSSNQTVSGQGSSKQKIQINKIQIPNPKPTNNQSEDYLESVRNQQKLKKKQQEIIKQKSKQNKSKNIQDHQDSSNKKQQKQMKSKKSSSNVVKQEREVIGNKQLKKMRNPNQNVVKDVLKHTKSQIKQNQQKDHQQSVKVQSKKNQIRPKTGVSKKREQDQQKVDKNNQISAKKSPQITKKTQNIRPSSHSKIRSSSHQQQKNLQNEVISTIQQAMSSKNNKESTSQQLPQSSKLKSNLLMRNKEGVQMMQKAKRRFKYELKQHQHELLVGKKKKQQSYVKKSTTSDNYVKQLKHRQEQNQAQVMNEQLKYYLQLRDKKVSYIKQMHKLVEKLQKQRQLDLHKKQQQLQSKQKQKVNKKLQQVDHLFEQNIKQIKQTYHEERAKSQIKSTAEVNILKQMQNNMNKNKESEMNVMKTLWEQERMKLELIAKDEESMKSKLEDLYRRNRV